MCRLRRTTVGAAAAPPAPAPAITVTDTGGTDGNTAIGKMDVVVWIGIPGTEIGIDETAAGPAKTGKTDEVAATAAADTTTGDGDGTANRIDVGSGIEAGTTSEADAKTENGTGEITGMEPTATDAEVRMLPAPKRRLEEAKENGRGISLDDENRRLVVVIVDVSAAGGEGATTGNVDLTGVVEEEEEWVGTAGTGAGAGAGGGRGTDIAIDDEGATGGGGQKVIVVTTEMVVVDMQILDRGADGDSGVVVNLGTGVVGEILGIDETDLRELLANLLDGSGGIRGFPS